MTRNVFYDTEFLEDGTTIELISIGMVDDEGNEFYAVNADMPWRRVWQHSWLRANVIPTLPTTRPGNSDLYMPNLDHRHPAVMARDGIRQGVHNFLAPHDEVPETQLWAYYSAYDHVALAQLWGRMIDLPHEIPMFTNDLMTLWHLAGCPEKPAQPDDQHNALADARWNSKLYDTCFWAVKNREAGLR